MLISACVNVCFFECSFSLLLGVFLGVMGGPLGKSVFSFCGTIDLFSTVAGLSCSPAGLQVPALNLCRFLLTPTPPLPAGKHTQVPWLSVWFVVPPLSTGLVFVVKSLSRVRLFATPWTAAHQASLSFTISELAQTYIH